MTKAQTAEREEAIAKLREWIKPGDRDLFRLLTSEALALLDDNDPDHDLLSHRDWIRSAKDALGRTK